MPKSESARKEQVYNSPSAAHEAFTMVLSGVDPKATPESELRNQLKLGGSYSSEETIGPLRIASTLTENTGNDAFQMLDEEIRRCIMLPDAAEKCKLVIFSDTFRQKRGTDKEIASRILGLSRKNETFSWEWKMFFVMQRVEDGEFRVIHKQFEYTADPARTDSEKFPLFDSQSISLSVK